MKKFFALILVVVLLFGGFITYKNWSSRESVIASQNDVAEQISQALSAQSGEDAQDESGEQTESPKIELDYDKLYALHDPDEVVMELGGKEITWGDYFYCLYSQASRISNTLTQMAMYYGSSA